MTQIQTLFKTLRFTSSASGLTEDQIKVILPILNEEAGARKVKRVQYLLHRSGLNVIKRLEDFDWLFNPKIPRDRIEAMASTEWKKDIRNFMLIGPEGVGKTHFANAVCYKAIQQGIPATFITCDELIKKITGASNKKALLNHYTTVTLLCIDEIGYVFPKSTEADEIFQIISRRNELTSTILTTNLIPSHWGKIFGPGTATAILDRLSYNGEFIKCDGRSYRRKK